MKSEEFINRRVSKYYWEDDINCATTVLKVLSEFFETPLNEQVINSTLGLPGAGKSGALCGLVSGTIMFLGIWGRQNSIPDNTIADYCKNFSSEFGNIFESLQCSVLRPEGFHSDNQPHICEAITCKAIGLSVDFLSNLINSQR